MKKKLFCALAVSLIIFSFTACTSDTYAEYMKMRRSQLQGAMLAPPDTLAKLQDYTDFAVRGILQADQKSEYDFAPAYLGMDHPISGSTISGLQVTEVLWSKEESSVQTGSRISIFEPYYAYEYHETPTLFYYSNYLPSEPGKEYIFFLNQRNGDYIVTWMESARFPLPDAQARSAASIDALTAEDLYLAEGVDLESYKALYREVLEAYAE